jgi:hypothetical protein
MNVPVGPLSERDLELWNSGPIVDQLPVKFDSGFVWTTINGNCRGCHANIHTGLFRGKLIRHSAQLVVLEAVGFCPACKLFTRFLYRLHDDRRVTGPRNGKWVTWRAKRESPLIRCVMHLLRAVGVLRRNS